MSRIALVTDSTANVPEAWARAHGVRVVPVYVRFGDEVYRDGVDMDSPTFYRRLATASSLPTTSQPSVGDFLDAYRQALIGVDAVISIHLSRHLSGTIASAETARSNLRAELPNSPPIYIVDTRTVSGPMALLVTAAARLAEADTPVEQIVTRLETIASSVATYFVVDTLHYLQKGGRIGTAAALVGSLLQIKPVLSIEDGRVEVVEKVRTKKRAHQRLLELVAERSGGSPIRVTVAHAAANDLAEATAEELRRRFDCRELLVVEFSPVVGVHGGPGTLGVGFYPSDLG